MIEPRYTGLRFDQRIAIVVDWSDGRPGGATTLASFFHDSFISADQRALIRDALARDVAPHVRVARGLWAHVHLRERDERRLVSPKPEKAKAEARAPTCVEAD